MFVFAGVLSKQSWNTKPDPKMSVVQGQSVLIKCVIDDLKGSVQWTKNGFALG